MKNYCLDVQTIRTFLIITLRNTNWITKRHVPSDVKLTKMIVSITTTSATIPRKGQSAAYLSLTRTKATPSEQLSDSSLASETLYATHLNPRRSDLSIERLILNLKIFWFAPSSKLVFLKSWRPAISYVKFFSALQMTIFWFYFTF